MHTSLDGYAAGPNDEMDWIHVDEEIFDMRVIVPMSRTLHHMDALLMS